MRREGWMIGGLLAVAGIVAVLMNLSWGAQERASEQAITERCGAGSSRLLAVYRDWQHEMFKPRAVVVACDRPGVRRVTMIYSQDTEMRDLCGHDRGVLVTKDVRYSNATHTFAVGRCDR